MNHPKFAWYSIVGSQEVEQGDLLKQVPIPIIPEAFYENYLSRSYSDMTEISDVGNTEYEEEVDTHQYDVILMTQSCDYQKLKDTDSVILCAHYDYRKWMELQELNGKKQWDNLRAGRRVGAYLLNECTLDGHSFGYRVVDLRNIFSVPYRFVKEIARVQIPRARLLPPYREHLSQAFARMFMRIGLPIDVQSEYPYTNS